MAKRQSTDEHNGGSGPKAKKQKRDVEPTAPEKIHSSRQLHSLFTDYNNVGKVQHGIQSLKGFLASCQVTLTSDAKSVERNLEIVLEYLDSQSSSEESCKDILQAWTYASQSNNFQLLSTIPTVLVQLLRTISPSSVFRKHGIALCKSLLQQVYLKIFYRSLTGNRDAITAPCLRLLTEINQFDHGSLCGLLQQSFDFTVKDIARNLDLKKGAKESLSEDPARPSVRTTFIRFILSFVEFGTTTVKTEILGLKTFVTPLFKHIKLDSAIVLKELFETLRQHVVNDGNLPRNTKTSLFNEWVLSRIADLYSRSDESVAETAHIFLKEICTTPNSGVCFKDNGWNAGEKGRVYNRALSGLLPHIRPYADVFQQELVVETFRACAELVANYFGINMSFSFDPKLTSTWIGFASFLTATIELPVPTLGEVPPSCGVVIENVLPGPLTKVVLTKALGHETNLIKFITTRLLNVAFAKLSLVLAAIDEASTGLVDSPWDTLHHSLVEEFCKRAPDMNVVIKLFNSLPADGALQREAVTRLLKNYFGVLPEVVAGHAIDLTGVLGKDWSTTSGEGMALLELRNTLSAVKETSEIKWWTKGSLPYSPFISLLKLYIEAPSSVPLPEIYELLVSVAGPSEMFQTETVVPPFEALVESLRKFKDVDGFGKILGFLDDCCQRCTRAPYKYFDEFATLVAQTPEEKTLQEGYVKPLSTILLTIAEQWSFFVAANTGDAIIATEWMVRMFESCWWVGENGLVLEELVKKLGKTTGYEAIFEKFLKRLVTWRCEEVTITREEVKVDSVRDLVEGAVLNVPPTLTDLQDASLMGVRCCQIMILAGCKSGNDGAFGAIETLGALLQTIVAKLVAEGKRELVLKSLKENWWYGRLFNLGNFVAGKTSIEETKLNMLVYQVMLRALVAAKIEQSVVSGHYLVQQFIQIVEPASAFNKSSKLLSTGPYTSIPYPVTQFNAQFFEIARVYIPLLDHKALRLVWGAVPQVPVEHYSQVFGLDVVTKHLVDMCWGPIRYFNPCDFGGDLRKLLPFTLVSKNLCRSLYEYVTTTTQVIALDKDCVLLVKKLLTLPCEYDSVVGKLALELVFKLPSPIDIVLETIAESKQTQQNSAWWVGILSRLATQDEKTRLYAWKTDVEDSTKDAFKKLFEKLLEHTNKQQKHPATAFDNDFRDGCPALEYAVSLYPDYSKAISSLEYPATVIERIRIFAPVGAVDLLEAIYQVSGIEQSVLSSYLSGQISYMTHQMQTYNTTSQGDWAAKQVRRFGEFVHKQRIPVYTLVHPSIVNAFLEAAFTNVEFVAEVIYLAAVFVSQAEAKDIEYRKFLQLILSSSACPLREREESKRSMNRQLTTIIKRFFNFAKVAQSNVTTLDGLLVLYRGTNDVVDIILLEIIVFIEGHLARSIATRISTWLLTDDEYSELITRDSHGRITLTINAKLVAKSVKNITSTPYPKLDVESTLNSVEDEEDEESTENYDLGFLLPILAYTLLTSESAFDIHALLDRSCVSLALTGLSSLSGEIRGMAESFLTACTARLETSNYRERAQATHLLCAILASLKTEEFDIKTTAVPAVVATFLASCLGVLTNPGHSLYDRIMTHLLKRPYLNLQDVPLIQPFLNSSEDFLKDALWVLNILIAGLKSPDDLVIFHKYRVFEQVMSIFSTPFTGSKLREKILELLWTAAGVEGGAGTLITRHGVLAWVQQRVGMIKDGEEEERMQLKRLAGRVYEGSSKGHMKRWGRGNIGRVLERIVLG